MVKVPGIEKYCLYEVYPYVQYTPIKENLDRAFENGVIKGLKTLLLSKKRENIIIDSYW